MKRNGNNRAMVVSKTQIPEGWRLVRLGDVLELDQPGAWGEDPTPAEPGVRVLRAADLTRDGQVKPGNAAWRRLSERDLERRLMQEGDLILERSGGGPGTPVGRVALVQGLGSVYCNNFCQQLRVDRAKCTPKYAARTLWHRYTQGVTARLEHQTTGIRNLDYAAYLNLPILLPPLPEQRAIAAVLDSIDDAIERTDAVIAATEQLRDSLLHQLLTRGVPGWHTEWKDVPGFGTIPVGWEIVRLGERIEEGPTNGIYKPESEYGSGVNLIRIGDFTFGQFVNFGAFQRIRATEEEIRRYQIREGDVIINRVNSLSHIGKSVLIPEVKEPTLFESNMMKIRFDRGLDLRFGAMVLLSDNTRRYFNAMAKKAVQQASINQQDVSELPVPLPPLAEQQAIAGLLDGVETTVAAANREREGFQSLKDSTADALLMGRVRVEV